MVKLVCPADNPRAEGVECAKTCQNYDLDCMSTGCVSGCLCPPGMVSYPSPYAWGPPFLFLLGGPARGRNETGVVVRVFSSPVSPKVREGDGRKLFGADPHGI